MANLEIDAAMIDVPVRGGAFRQTALEALGGPLVLLAMADFNCRYDEALLATQPRV